MKINGVGNQVIPAQTDKAPGTLNVQDFLKIMTAQLQNLDPMGESGADSTEYINQMAQFTMLEQLSSLMAGMENMSLLTQQQMSFSLVGKNVQVATEEGTLTGVVEKVRYRNGQAYPVIQGVEYPLGAVTEVGEK